MSEKTEQPTRKKIRDARNKGQVYKSKEIVSLSMLISIVLCFVVFGDYILAQLKMLFKLPVKYYDVEMEYGLLAAIFESLLIASKVLAPFLGFTFITAIFSNALQTGWALSFEPIKPKLEKVSVIQGFKKIFSANNALEFFKSIVKIIVLTVTAWYVVKDSLLVILSVPTCGAQCALSITSMLILYLILYCLGVFLILAIIDFVFEKYSYYKKLRMSKDEVKREYKDTEGNPEIKGKRKQIHREISSEEAFVNSVKTANVVVANPIHYAVCLRYEDTISQLPYVCMKGEHLLAKRIRTIAEQHDIPVIENVPLARAMYADLDINEKITEQYIKPVAEIIRWLRANAKDCD
ncbi:type III secretion system export apparatus subunit SctU [Pleionea sediminis]|uniref:type III secretion system export apparatus subunit SctU n=1 Tax=Pleionea sediminis TaxID=2569479 RepID=UPI001184C6E8|nr:type III secretion system export apparatus subunit SctU [Pleionea sediminis]